MSLDHPLRIGDVAADVAAGDVDVDPRRRHRALGADDHRARHLPDRRELAERDLRDAPVGIAEPPIARRHRIAPTRARRCALAGVRRRGSPERAPRETLGRVAQLLRIAHAHAVALAPLDGLRDRHPADRRRDHSLHVGDVHAVPRGRRAIDVDVQVVARLPPARRRRCACPGPSAPLARPACRCARARARSGPKILMPTGVRIPVASMSMRPLIGIVHAFVTPGIRTAESIAATSASYVMPAPPLRFAA